MTKQRHLNLRSALKNRRLTQKIDYLITSSKWAIPIFLLVMFVMFQSTFYLGRFPMQWIEWGIQELSLLLSRLLPDGALKCLLIDGVIGGVGGVLVFLPNILILYAFISFIEESGYIDRAAKTMDKTMHLMGLHGRSFVPLIMGFGCNVPAILSTSSIKSHNSRLITILVNPFMSCSARLPIYILIAGTFFPHHSGWILMGIYLLGILAAAFTAHLLRKVLFTTPEEPHEQLLRPYKLPTLKSVVRETWNKAIDYIRKLGGLILIVSIIMWFLNYYPRPEGDNPQKGNEHSYIAQIGQTIAPIFKPLGLQWETAVSLVAGSAAKELVISTMGVLYADGNEDNAILSQQLLTPNKITGIPAFTTASALAFIVFVLMYCPCIASLAAIARESGSWKWAFFSFIYNTSLAWICGFITYHIALLV